MTLQMKATAYGEPDTLQSFDVDVPEPGPGEVRIAVRAAGVNPTDFKTISGYRGTDPDDLPLPIGYEVSGVIDALGPDTRIASGDGEVGDPVVAFRVTGGYSEALIVPAADVFAKPGRLDHPEAANLLLVGTTAADMLRVVPVEAGRTVLVHGASGAAGVSLLQQLRALGVAAIGTCGESSEDAVSRFGATPVRYGEGLEQRVRDLAPDGIDAAYDCVGTDEAVDVSLALVAPDRLVTIAAPQRAKDEGFHAVAGAMPESAAFRDSIRGDILAMAADGALVVPMARTYPLAEAVEALEFLKGEHPGGKIALIP